jgi:hypothetical protein
MDRDAILRGKTRLVRALARVASAAAFFSRSRASMARL